MLTSVTEQKVQTSKWPVNLPRQCICIGNANTPALTATDKTVSSSPVAAVILGGLPKEPVGS